MRRLLMLDSGAFSVWSKGSVIDLKEYRAFCCRFPDISYYVSLDVIPGVIREKRSLTKVSIEASCQQSWKNYQSMLKKLPIEKVIPVFHQNDGIQWLERYLAFGTPYIGISPANDCTTREKIRWLKTLKPYLFDSDGKPVVKTHGFAVTSYHLMKLKGWQWYSVDSASWKKVASCGSIYFPKRTGRDRDFSKPPSIIGVSPVSSSRFKYGRHVGISKLLSTFNGRLGEWLEEVGVEIGKYEVVSVEPSYRIGREGRDFWYNEKKNQILKVLEKGVVPNWEKRAQVNAYFLKQVMIHKATHVKHIYYAGAPRKDIEPFLGIRLLSYQDLRSRSDKSITMQRLLEHLQRIRDNEPW